MLLILESHFLVSEILTLTLAELEFYLLDNLHIKLEVFDEVGVVERLVFTIHTPPLAVFAAKDCHVVHKFILPLSRRSQ